MWLLRNEEVRDALRKNGLKLASVLTYSLAYGQHVWKASRPIIATVDYTWYAHKTQRTI